MLANFADPEKARALLLEQRDGDEALAIKQQTDPVVELCAALEFLEEARGLMMGGGGDTVKYLTRNSLYRVYMAFMAYTGKGKCLSVNEFGKGYEGQRRKFTDMNILREKLRESRRPTQRLLMIAMRFIKMAMVIYLVYLTEIKYFYFNVLMRVDNYFSLSHLLSTLSTHFVDR